MSVKHINIKDLLDYEGKEGLILQGCGGDPQEWIDGINDLFTKQELLLDGTKFNADDCAVFDNGGVTCILYPFSEDIHPRCGCVQRRHAFSTVIGSGRLAAGECHYLRSTKSPPGQGRH